MTKFRTFLGFSLRDKLLFSEVMLSLLIARIRVRFSSQRWLVNQWGQLHHETAFTLTSKQEQHAKRLTQQFNVATNNIPHDMFNCRVQATAARWMLRRRGVSSTVYVGFRRSREDDTGFDGHAWLRSGPIIVTGKRQMAGFTIVSKYGSTDE